MYEEIKRQMEQDIGKERFEHCLRTADFALELAEINNADKEKAYLAGLLHDCGKFKDKKLLYKKASKYEMLSSYFGKDSEKVLHAYFGAILAREKFKIEDEEILRAIKYHATGRADMTLLEKIIYCADTFERGRTYREADELREITIRDLNAGLLEGLRFTLMNLSNSYLYIDKNTFEAYNFIVKEMSEKLG